MKKRNRILSLLLVLVLMLSMLPVSAAASDTSDSKEEKTASVKIKVVASSKTLYTYTVKVGDKAVTLENDNYITHKNSVYKFSHYTVSGKKKSSVTIPAYDGTNDWKKKWGETISVVYTAHTHKYHPGYSRLYHWSICACGDTTNEVRHVDPATDDDKICTCGYAFSSNADLSTLWLANMQLSPRFVKETTEYIGEVHTYLDVTSTSITARPFDALATVQLPENLEIHEGANKFQIVVTAEDKAATKTYTVIAVKPVKVEDVLIGSDGITVSAKQKPKLTWPTAAVSIPEAAGKKMVELAAADACSQISIRPDFSKWGATQLDVSLTAALLNTIAEKTEADLLIETPYDSVLTIPHSQLSTLAENGDITVTITREGSYSFSAGEDGTELTGLSEQITLTLPETST